MQKKTDNTHPPIQQPQYVQAFTNLPPQQQQVYYTPRVSQNILVTSVPQRSSQILSQSQQVYATPQSQQISSSQVVDLTKSQDKSPSAGSSEKIKKLREKAKKSRAGKSNEFQKYELEIEAKNKEIQEQQLVITLQKEELDQKNQESEQKDLEIQQFKHELEQKIMQIKELTQTLTTTEQNLEASQAQYELDLQQMTDRNQEFISQKLQFSLVTQNLLKKSQQQFNWEHRSQHIQKFLNLIKPDIYLVQELCPEYHETLIESLQSHCFVEDDYKGWQIEGNIYWNENLFEKIQHGNEFIGHVEREELNRQLFWVRLRSKLNQKTLLVATAHLTHQASEEDLTSNLDPRKRQAKNIMEVIRKIAENVEEAVIIAGDMNDPKGVSLILKERGFRSCEEKLNLQMQPTHPARSMGIPEDQCPDQKLDWIYSNDNVEAMITTVPKVTDSNLSDHYPVYALFKL